MQPTDRQWFTYPTYTDRPGMPVVTKVSYAEDTNSIAIILCHTPGQC